MLRNAAADRRRPNNEGGDPGCLRLRHGQILNPCVDSASWQANLSDAVCASPMNETEAGFAVSCIDDIAEEYGEWQLKLDDVRAQAFPRVYSHS
jgi:hypothetical protein